MLARQYARDSIATAPLSDWIAFLHDLARHAFQALRPGGYLALLLAAQTEKDLPAGFGYLDHAFFGYAAAPTAGFLPERRISCPMDGAYLPQHVRRARDEGRLLGQVRDLLVMRKPSHDRMIDPGHRHSTAGTIPLRSCVKREKRLLKWCQLDCHSGICHFGSRARCLPAGLPSHACSANVSGLIRRRHAVRSRAIPEAIAVRIRRHRPQSDSGLEPQASS